MRTIEWDDARECIAMVDQTQLPTTTETYYAETVSELIDSIQRLRVRGAPALGAAGAYGVALATRQHDGAEFSTFAAAVRDDAARIAAARPTAVNLSREVENVVSVLDEVASISAARVQTLEMAERIADADVARNKQIGKQGQSLLADGDTIMTHCNAGALATVDWGTALGVVYAASAVGKTIDVMAPETRPLNQGARLTTVEVQDRNIEVTLLPDSASGLAMQTEQIDAIIVGADRIVLSGGSQFGEQGVVFNKIGTYTHAVLADRHDIPFIVAAPHSTIDTRRSADEIEIEFRDPAELREIYGTQNAPSDVPVYNPAFDPTPMELVDYLVTESGVYQPPLSEEVFRSHADTVGPVGLPEQD